MSGLFCQPQSLVVKKPFCCFGYYKFSHGSGFCRRCHRKERRALRLFLDGQRHNLKEPFEIVRDSKSIPVA